MTTEEVKPDFKIKKKYIMTPEKQKEYYARYRAKHFPLMVKAAADKKPSNEEIIPQVAFIKTKRKCITTPENQKKYNARYRAKHFTPVVKDTVEKKPSDQKKYSLEYQRTHR